MGLTVETKYGKVEGFEEGGVKKWLGVPFAKPPVGELRFRHSVPPEPWEGVRECKEMAPMPFQFFNPPHVPKFDWPESEDCLYLNVAAPAEGEKMPVFLWIYGGAYHMGGTAMPDYRIENFARDGIVAVSIAYRLGPLGFFSFYKHSDRFDANCGFSDVVSGIRWVYENIEAFGGDPDNITICGESAGGTMVFCALSSPAVKGCFSKAITMSGLATDVLSHRANDLRTDLLLEDFGIAPDEVDKLEDWTCEEMLPHVERVYMAGDQEYPGVVLAGPECDGDLLPLGVWDALEAGNAAGVNCIMGTCHDEGRLFTMNKEVPTTWDAVAEMLANNDLSDMMPRIREVYADAPDESEACSRMCGDRMFWSGTVKASLAQSTQADVYAYRFDFVPAGAASFGLGATHSVDIQPMFDVYDNPMSFYAGTPREQEEAVHAWLHGAAVNFCKTGDPNGAIPIEWPKVTPGARPTMLIDVECSVEDDPNPERFDVWKDVVLYQ